MGSLVERVAGVATSLLGSEAVTRARTVLTPADYVGNTATLSAPETSRAPSAIASAKGKQRARRRTTAGARATSVLTSIDDGALGG